MFQSIYLSRYRLCQVVAAIILACVLRMFPQKSSLQGETGILQQVKIHEESHNESSILADNHYEVLKVMQPRGGPIGDLSEESDPTSNAQQRHDNDALHFYVHVPKTAGSAVCDHLKRMMKQTTSLRWSKKLYKAIQSIINQHGTNWRDGICNKFEKQFQHYKEWQAEEASQGIKCRLYISEASYLPQFRNSSIFYTMIRDPREHILSQYFHCTEAPVHRKKELMPPFTEWMRFYAQESTEQISLDKKHFANFNCYDPRNLQSRYLMFNGTEKGLQDLTNKFEVIGLSSRFEESICLLFIHLTSGSFIPEECNCSSKRRQLKYDHGVKHHGSSFKKLTEEQRSLIKKLTVNDKMLYRYVSDVFFDEQVARFEETYSFKLCQ